MCIKVGVGDDSIKLKCSTSCFREKNVHLGITVVKIINKVLAFDDMPCLGSVLGKFNCITVQYNGTQHSILTSFPYEKWFNVIYNYYIDRKYCKYNDVLQDSSSLG